MDYKELKIDNSDKTENGLIDRLYQLERQVEPCPLLSLIGDLIQYTQHNAGR
jgi:hypothetical protein